MFSDAGPAPVQSHLFNYSVIFSVINSVNADICALDEMEGHAAKPISYILAFDNGE